jgi:hypothetical protein
MERRKNGVRTIYRPSGGPIVRVKPGPNNSLGWEPPPEVRDIIARVTLATLRRHGYAG